MHKRWNIIALNFLKHCNNSGAPFRVAMSTIANNEVSTKQFHPEQRRRDVDERAADNRGRSIRRFVGKDSTKSQPNTNSSLWLMRNVPNSQRRSLVVTLGQRG
jgi:hypothetical protein